jgi:hypothetical protein
MTAVEELIAVLKANKADLSQFEDVLAEISGALGSLCKSADRSHTAIGEAIKSSLRELKVTVSAPAVKVDAPTVHVSAPTVNVQPPKVTVEAPTVNVGSPTVNVKPADVVFMPSPAPALKGWTLTVVSRTETGAIRSLSLKPE